MPSGDGSEICFHKGKVYLEGLLADPVDEEDVLVVEIKGGCLNVVCDQNLVIVGDVKGDIKAEGKEGGVCIHGSVEKNANITAKSVQIFGDTRGKVTAENVECANLVGNIEATNVDCIVE